MWIDGPIGLFFRGILITPPLPRLHNNKVGRVPNVTSEDFCTTKRSGDITKMSFCWHFSFHKSNHMEPSSLPTSFASYVSLATNATRITGQCCGAVSFVLCFAVVLTGLMFPSFMLSWDRVFPHILFFISFCDCLTALGFTFGFPRNGTPLCNAQAVLYIFFSLSSFSWTVLLVYQLRCTLIFRKIWLGVAHMHMLAWVVPLLMTFVPLKFEVEFGTFFEGASLCAFNSSSVNKVLHVYYLFYSCFVFGLLAMTAMSIETMFRYQSETDGLGRAAWKVFTSMRLFPIFISVFWFPLLIISILFSLGLFSLTDSSTRIAIRNVAVICCVLNGAAFAAVFFFSSGEARHKWTCLLRRWGCLQRPPPCDPPPFSTDSEASRDSISPCEHGHETKRPLSSELFDGLGSSVDKSRIRLSDLHPGAGAGGGGRRGDDDDDVRDNDAVLMDALQQNRKPRGGDTSMETEEERSARQGQGEAGGEEHSVSQRLWSLLSTSPSRGSPLMGYSPSMGSPLLAGTPPSGSSRWQFLGTSPLSTPHAGSVASWMSASGSVAKEAEGAEGGEGHDSDVELSAQGLHHSSRTASSSSPQAFAPVMNEEFCWSPSGRS